MDIYSARASRDIAIKELFLLERHHLGTPDARCKECEISHQMTASALMSEAGRMNDGNKEDLEIARKIDNINFNLPQRELQQEVRKIRKWIMSGEGIAECNENTCSVISKEITGTENSQEDYTWLYILGGLALVLILLKLKS